VRGILPDHRSQYSLVLSTTLDSNDVAHDHHAPTRDPASGNASEAPKEVQHGSVFCDSAHQVAEREQAERGKIHHLRPKMSDSRP
jgi:hypothetical protein